MYRKIKIAKKVIKGLIIFLLSVMLIGIIGNIFYIANSHDNFKPKSYYVQVGIPQLDVDIAR